MEVSLKNWWDSWTGRKKSIFETALAKVDMKLG